MKNKLVTRLIAGLVLWAWVLLTAAIYQKAFSKTLTCPCQQQEAPSTPQPSNAIITF